MNIKRLRAMLVKEYRQMFRDSSNIILGVVLPLVLIIIFGYGLSLDIKNVPVAVVADAASEESTDIIHGLQASSYFTVYHTSTFQEAESILLSGKVDAIVNIPQDFLRSRELQVIVKGTDANYARLVQNYIQGVVIHLHSTETGAAGLNLSIRTWFNDEMTSNYSLISGLIVLIMTLIGALLTALVMAREWERGTLESLFVTPVKIMEILLGKIVPYLTLGLVGFAMCLLAAKFMFDIPFVGSIPVLILAGVLYLLVSLEFGLTVSSIVKNQFHASQLVLVTAFLPSIMLSGFLFDFNSAPVFVQIVAHIIPATWFVEILQTILLAGNVYFIIFRDFAILILYLILFTATILATTKKDVC